MTERRPKRTNSVCTKYRRELTELPLSKYRSRTAISILRPVYTRWAADTSYHRQRPIKTPAQQSKAVDRRRTTRDGRRFQTTGDWATPHWSLLEPWLPWSRCVVNGSLIISGDPLNCQTIHPAFAMDTTMHGYKINLPFLHGPGYDLIKLHPSANDLHCRKAP